MPPKSAHVKRSKEHNVRATCAAKRKQGPKARSRRPPKKRGIEYSRENDLLLKYLERGLPLGILSPSEVENFTAALETILQHDPSNSSADARTNCHTACGKLLKLFRDDYHAVVNSLVVIKDILNLLIHISTEYATFDQFDISTSVDCLAIFVSSLAANNFRGSKKPFTTFRRMFNVLFTTRIDKFHLTYRAKGVIIGILNELLKDYKFLREKEQEECRGIVLNLMKFILEKNEKKSSMASTFLKECSRYVVYVIYEILHPCLTKNLSRSENPPPLNKTNTTVHQLIIKLFKVDPRLISEPLVTCILYCMRIQSKKTDTLILIFKLFINTTPGGHLTDLWKKLKTWYSADKDLSVADVKVLYEFSPALLTCGSLTLRKEWLENLVHLVRNSRHKKFDFLLAITEAETCKPGFFRWKETRSILKPLLKTKSPDELDDETKGFFLQSLCYRYLLSLREGLYDEAKGLLKLILNATFDNEGASYEDWALARVLIGILTAQDESPEKRAWHLVVFHTFCYSEDMGNAVAVLRESYRYSPAVSRAMNRLFNVQQDVLSQEKLDYLSRSLISEIQCEDEPPDAETMNAIVKKTRDDRAFCEKLRKLTSLDGHREKQNKVDIKSDLKIQKRKVPTFADKFFATVEPLVNWSEMRILKKYVDKLLEMETEDSDDSNVRPLPRFISLEDIAHTICESIFRCPHLAYDADTLKVILTIMASSVGFSTSLAMRSIYAAQNYACPDKQLLDHVRWTPAQVRDIRQTCCALLEVIKQYCLTRKTMNNKNFQKARGSLKRSLRILGGVLVSEDISYIQDTETMLQTEDRLSDPYVLAVATLGFLAASKGFRKTFQFHIWKIADGLLNRVTNSWKTDISCVQRFDNLTWMESSDLPIEVRVVVEEYRTVGRCLRYCCPVEKATPAFVEEMTNLFLRAIPDAYHLISDNHSEEMGSGSPNDMFCSVSAGKIRLEAACVTLSMLESQWFSRKLTVEVIINLAEFAMDPMAAVRMTFVEKLTQGLCFVTNWSVDTSGKSRGKLPSLLAALIPLITLRSADRISEEYFEKEYDVDVETAGIQLIRFAKGRRRCMYRIQNWSENIPAKRVPYELPELIPEFLLCWLVPVLAKLPLMSWYHTTSQLKSLSDPHKGLVRMILTCFDVVLKAMTHEAAFSPRLSFNVVRRLPTEMLKFMKFAILREQSRQVLLCVLLELAIEHYIEEHGVEDKPRHYPINNILSKGELFYDMKNPRSDFFMKKHEVKTIVKKSMISQHMNVLENINAPTAETWSQSSPGSSERPQDYRDDGCGTSSDDWESSLLGTPQVLQSRIGRKRRRSADSPERSSKRSSLTSWAPSISPTESQ